MLLSAVFYTIWPNLFSGIGGIDLGFQQAGFEIVWANEFDKDAAHTYRRNLGGNHLVEKDIRTVDATSIPDFDVLVDCHFSQTVLRYLHGLVPKGSGSMADDAGGQ